MVIKIKGQNFTTLLIIYWAGLFDKLGNNYWCLPVELQKPV